MNRSEEGRWRVEEQKKQERKKGNWKRKRKREPNKNEGTTERENGWLDKERWDMGRRSLMHMAFFIFVVVCC